MADEKKPSNTERRYGKKVKHHGTSSPEGETSVPQVKNSAKAVKPPADSGRVGETDSGPTPSVDAGTEGVPVNERHERERSETHGRHSSERGAMFKRHQAELDKMGKRHLDEVTQASSSQGAHESVVESNEKDAA